MFNQSLLIFSKNTKGFEGYFFGYLHVLVICTIHEKDTPYNTAGIPYACPEKVIYCDDHPRPDTDGGISNFTGLPE